MWWWGVAQAAVLDVGAGQPYATVADAIAVAIDGDAIVLHDALLTEEVEVVGKDLEIRGDKSTRWHVTAGPAVALRNGSHVRIVGIRFSGPYSALTVDDGDAVVVDSTFAGFEWAIAVGWTTPATLEVLRTAFTDNTNSIATGAGSTVEVADSRFLRNRPDPIGSVSAIWGEESTTVVVDRTIFAGNKGDGYLMRCDACTIRDSLFVGNQSTELELVLVSGEAVLERNRFCGNESAGGYGVLWFSGGPATLRNNAFVANSTAMGTSVLSAEEASLVLEHNTFLGNDTPVGPMAQAFADTVGVEVTMVGNLVAGNTSSEPAFQDWASAVVVNPSYNAWFANSGGDASFALGATDLVGANPLLGAGTPCSWDRLTPAPGSPLIDGDPTLLDADGSPADIGATGGPSAP